MNKLLNESQIAISHFWDGERDHDHAYPHATWFGIKIPISSQVHWWKTRSMLDGKKHHPEKHVLTFVGERNYGMIPGLEPFSEFHLTVSAFNSRGHGPESSPVFFETPEGGKTRGKYGMEGQKLKLSLGQGELIPLFKVIIKTPPFVEHFTRKGSCGCWAKLYPHLTRICRDRPVLSPLKAHPRLFQSLNNHVFSGSWTLTRTQSLCPGGFPRKPTATSLATFCSTR